MSDDKRWSDYFTIKARVASFCAAVVLPIIPSVMLLAASMFVVSVTIATEPAATRWKVASVLGSALAISYTAANVDSWLLQGLVIIVVVAALSCVFLRTSGQPAEAPTDP